MKYFFALFLYSAAFTLSAQESNFDVISQIADSSASELIANIQNVGVQSFTSEIAEHSAAWLLEQKLLENATSNDIKVLSDTGSKLKIEIAKLEVEYKLHPDSDSLYRNISMNLFARIDHNNELINVSSADKLYSDVIGYDDAQLLQSGNYAFTNGIIPEQNNGFFEEYIEPIIITSAAIVTVILFFTVRSN